MCGLSRYCVHQKRISLIRMRMIVIIINNIYIYCIYNKGIEHPIRKKPCWAVLYSYLLLDVEHSAGAG